MAVFLSPVGGVAAQFFTNTGAVLTGGKLYTYSAGTTTPAVTYTSSSGAVANTNPIVLDAAGRVPSSGEIWLSDGISYKFVLKDSNDVLIATYDNITGINSNFVNFTNEQELQTATANQTVFTLTTMQYQPGTGSLSVFVDGVNQYGPSINYAFTETDATTVTFLNGLHVGASVKFTTSAINASSYGDAFQISYTPPFTGSVATNVGDKLAETISVIDFGAASTNTNVQNKAALQVAISTINAMGGGHIVIPSDINYGYRRSTGATWPDFSAATTNITIEDYSPGNTYTAPSRDGAQVRWWFRTEGNQDDGFHDGNTWWHRAKYDPTFVISNDQGSLINAQTYGRRATFLFCSDGVSNWVLGQGGKKGAGLTENDLAQWYLAAFGDYAGASYPDGTGVWQINKTTGGWGINSDPVAGFSVIWNAPQAGYGAWMLKSEDSTAGFYLRNLTGISQDVRVQNNAGVLQFIEGGQVGAQLKGTLYNVKGPTGVSTATYTVATDDTDLLISAGATCTLTLPSPASYTGRVLNVLTQQAFTVVSASSNVVGITGGAAGTSILSASAGKWARLVSNGSNWVINMSN
jgi:hypothetical protein